MKKNNDYKITIDEFWNSKFNAIHCKNKAQFKVVVNVFAKMNKYCKNGLKFRERNGEDYSRFLFTTFGSDGSMGLKMHYKKDCNIYEFIEVDFSKYLKADEELTF